MRLLRIALISAVVVAGLAPGTPVTLVLGLGLAEPPIATPYGELEVGGAQPRRIALPPEADRSSPGGATVEFAQSWWRLALAVGLYLVFLLAHGWLFGAPALG